jgi:hypothetical protein
MGFWDVPARTMRKHALGKRRFVLEVGLLQFGLPWALFMIALRWFGFFPGPKLLDTVDFIRLGAIWLVTGAITGLLFGLSMWKIVCRQKAREGARL